MVKIVENKQDVNKSTYKSMAWRSLFEAWKITSDLWGNYLSIRYKGEEYLIKYKREPKEKFDYRLKSSIFTNYFAETIETLSGTAFKSNPAPVELPEPLNTYLNDFDMCGNDFYTWNLGNFELFLRDGNGFIYVDAPPAPPTETSENGNIDKPLLNQRLDDRPFCTYYEACQLINHKYTKIGSREILSQATIEIKTIDEKGVYGEEEATRHLILSVGYFRVDKLNSETKEFEEEIPETATGLSYIPLFPITKIGTNPPLLNLAGVNIDYYNQVSDYKNALHLCCNPEKIQQYDSKSDAEAAANIQTASPGIGKKIWGANAKVYYAEITGSGLNLVKEFYKDLETQMMRMGADMFTPSSTITQTATEVMDTAGRRQSKLARLVRLWENAIEKALYAMADYENAIKGSVVVNLETVEKAKFKMRIDYDRLTFSLDELRFADELVTKGRFSLKTLLQMMSEGMNLPEGFTADEEIKQIASERKMLKDSVGASVQP